MIPGMLWEWKGLLTCTMIVSSWSCFPVWMPVTPEQTEETSNIVELSFPPSTWRCGTSAYFRGTAMTGQNDDWHIISPPLAEDQLENVPGIPSNSGLLASFIQHHGPARNSTYGLNPNFNTAFITLIFLGKRRGLLKVSQKYRSICYLDVAADQRWGVTEIWTAVLTGATSNQLDQSQMCS